MSREEQLAILCECFTSATKVHGNPGDFGHKPRDYATFVARELRRLSAVNLPTRMSLADCQKLAEDLDRGEFDPELAVWMGYT